MEDNKNKLTELVSQTQEAMERFKYSLSTQNQMSKALNELVEFAVSQDISVYTEELGQRFLLEKYNYNGTEPIGKMSNQKANAIRAIRKIGEFQLYGGFYRVRQSRKNIDWAMGDIEVINAFIKHMSNADMTENTKKRALFSIQKLYDFARSQGLTRITDITYENLNGFILSLQGDSLRYAKGKIATLKNFFRYLYLNEYISVDYSGAFPKIFAPRNKSLPAIWSVEDIKELLQVIDRGSPVGKRDFAIFMLVAGLGLRASDVSGVLLSNFDWDKREISITQQKTGKINVCPITDEVGWAVIDYIRYGRPQSTLPYLFITASAPYTRLGPTVAICALKRYMQKAGLHETQKGITKGMHSLRHSFARLLLEQDIDLELLADIMGHTKIKSSSPYLKIDFTGLRECALSLSGVKNYIEKINA
jgi:site-specific recombinase XerD